MVRQPEVVSTANLFWGGAVSSQSDSELGRRRRDHPSTVVYSLPHSPPNTSGFHAGASSTAPSAGCGFSTPHPVARPSMSKLVKCLEGWPCIHLPFSSTEWLIAQSWRIHFGELHLDCILLPSPPLLDKWGHTRCYSQWNFYGWEMFRFGGT